MVMRTAGSPHDALVLLRTREHLPEHEATVHRDIASRIARILGLPFQGEFSAQEHSGLRCYFIPDATLIGIKTLESLAISGEEDLFGGFAQWDFLPTKAVAHGLVAGSAERPQGWSESFSEQVKGSTLPGFTAFSRADAREAARLLLKQHIRVRLKPVHATAGRGQVVLQSMDDLDFALLDQDENALSECGVVLEAQLEHVVTYSVGQVRLPGLVASYIGTQSLTRDNHGEEVYGGSRLQICRGDYSALDQLDLDDETRRAVKVAAEFDAAADAGYPEFFASRRNYDVAAGLDAHQARHLGVLEQSWRIGGASRAEVAALEAFASDPSCDHLQAETIELFGADAKAPPEAIETFSGLDPELGLIRKYVMVKAYGNKQ